MMMKKQKLCFDDVGWVRGPLLGRGGFGSVFMAVVQQNKKYVLGLPSVFAVKTASSPAYFELSDEEKFLDEIGECPHIIRSFGNSLTVNEKGDDFIFNLFLEYASGGTLLDLLRRYGGGLPETEVRRHARSVLLGIDHIHRSGLVHCDLKPENVLLVVDDNSGEFVAKIGDFGLAKRAGRSGLVPVRGTTMYLSPEAAVHGVQEAPADIWAFGCVVLQLLTGNRPWRLKSGWKTQEIVDHIGSPGNSPEVPGGLSVLARDFLGRCFSRSPRMRWTAKELLGHPFLAAGENVDVGARRKRRSPEYYFLGAAAKRRRASCNADEVIVISSD